MPSSAHALLLAAASTLAASRGHGCEARLLTSAAAGIAYQGAFEKLQERLGERPDADCRRVEVLVDQDGARVTVRSADGREAQRTVASPAELLATVEALLVTLPDPPAAHSPPQQPPPAPPAAPPPREREVRLLVGAASGARITAPGPALSPSAGGFAALLLDPWVLGVFSRWEMAYVSLPGNTPAGFNMNGLVVGIDVGRRLAFGPGALQLGATLAAGALNEEGAEEGVGGQLAEARVGAYSAFIAGSRAALRLRPQMELDAVPTRLLNGRSAHPLLPRPPVVGLTLSLGVETDL